MLDAVHGLGSLVSSAAASLCCALRLMMMMPLRYPPIPVAFLALFGVNAEVVWVDEATGRFRVERTGAAPVTDRVVAVPLSHTHTRSQNPDDGFPADDDDDHHHELLLATDGESVQVTTLISGGGGCMGSVETPTSMVFRALLLLFLAPLSLSLSGGALCTAARDSRGLAMS